jgi:putative ABC transport system permease protein
LPTGRDIRFRNADIDRVAREEETMVEHLTGRFYLSGTFNIAWGNKTNAFFVRCVHPDHRYLENTEILTGRFVNKTDIRDYRKICVIGIDVAEFFFPDGENPLGQYLTIKGVPYQVVGTFKDSGGRNENKQIYLPISTAQRTENGTDRVNQIMLTFGDASLGDSKEMEERLRKRFADVHRFDAEDPQAIYLSNDLEEFKRFQGLFNGIEGFVWVIGILSLIAGIIGISNIMLIAVTERTREIGVRKALGATNGSLVQLILWESIVLTGLSGFLGMCLGVGLLWSVDSFVLPPEPDPGSMFMHPGVTPAVILVSLTILVGSGALAGFIPAVRAVRIAPAVAMKGA